ncbi:MAG: ATP-binding cassette domain-containing protein, partial [Bdellovibrionota bacterium]
MKTVIRLENVSKSYFLGSVEVPALKSANLEIHSGEFTAVIGASGSGKSTLLNLIGCIDDPTSGRVWLEN